jgi:hypothetical protein
MLQSKYLMIYQGIKIRLTNDVNNITTNTCNITANTNSINAINNSLSNYVLTSDTKHSPCKCEHNHQFNQYLSQCSSNNQNKYSIFILTMYFPHFR